MNDRLMMENYLLLLKANTEVYVHGTLESSNVENRKILKEGLDNTLTSQADIFNKMEEYNYYNVSNVNASDIRKKLNEINN